MAHRPQPRGPSHRGRHGAVAALPRPGSRARRQGLLRHSRSRRSQVRLPRGGQRGLRRARLGWPSGLPDLRRTRGLPSGGLWPTGSVAAGPARQDDGMGSPAMASVRAEAPAGQPVARAACGRVGRLPHLRYVVAAPPVLSSPHRHQTRRRARRRYPCCRDRTSGLRLLPGRDRQPSKQARLVKVGQT